MNVRPVVMEGNSTRIGMADGFESEPVLNLTLLPVQGRQLGGQGRELWMAGRDRSPQDRVLRVAAALEDVVIVENAL